MHGSHTVVWDDRQHTHNNTTPQHLFLDAGQLLLEVSQELLYARHFRLKISTCRCPFCLGHRCNSLLLMLRAPPVMPALFASEIGVGERQELQQ